MNITQETSIQIKINTLSMFQYLNQYFDIQCLQTAWTDDQNSDPFNTFIYFIFTVSSLVSPVNSLKSRLQG